MFFEKLRKRWGEWVIRSYVHHRRYLDKGFEQIDWGKKIFQLLFYAGGFAYIVSDYVVLKPWHWGMLAFFFVGFCWSVGAIWDKMKGYDIEAEWSNKRNPFVEDVEKKMDQDMNKVYAVMFGLSMRFAKEKGMEEELQVYLSKNYKEEEN